MEIATMSVADATKQLAVIQQREKQRLLEQGNGKAQVAFARDVKNSLLFQYDWSDLLSAAPLALSLMGSCYVAATSPVAHAISLEDAMPKDGFRYIKYPILKACLVQVSDAGRMAFITAEKNMDLINRTSASLGGYMSSISQYIPALPDPGAQDALLNKLQLLKNGSDDCLRYAQGIEQEFKNWLHLVCELHQVTVAKEGKNAEAQEANETDIGGLKIEAELQENHLRFNEEWAQNLKEDLDFDRKMFLEAAAALPGPWESIGLSLAESVIAGATTSISQTMSFMMDTSKTVCSKLVYPLVYPRRGIYPEYRASIGVSPIITTFATLLRAETNEDVDWDGLRGNTNEEYAPLRFMKAHLNHYSKVVQSDTSSTLSSGELKEALDKSMKVIERVEQVVKKDKQLVCTGPSRQEIHQWQEDIKIAKASVIKLETMAISSSGNAPHTAPKMTDAVETPAQSENRTDRLTALNIAVERINNSQAAYRVAQDNYTKACDKAAKVASELARIKANLKSLTEKNLTMADIKKILIQCIGTLIQMKAQITNLVRFFSSLSALVEHVVRQNVVDFVQQVESSQRLLMGNISLLDISRQELYTTSLMCQAYFSLFSTIAKMYTKVSIDHIMPGVKLCDKLSMSADGDPNAILVRSRELEQFTDNAQKAVRELVFQSQREITDTLEARVKRVEKDIQVLPMLPPTIANAINYGRETITMSVSREFDNYQAPALVADYSMNPDEI